MSLPGKDEGLSFDEFHSSLGSVKTLKIRWMFEGVFDLIDVRWMRKMERVYDECTENSMFVGSRESINSKKSLSKFMYIHILHR